MDKLKYLIFAALFFASAASALDIASQGVSVSYGRTGSSNINGGRIGYQVLPAKTNWKNFSIYFELSAALWHTNKNNNKTIGTIALAPTVRFRLMLTKYFVPYIEASVGPSFLSTTKFGGRRLGANYAFQDILGGGVNFGDKRQYDVSWRFLHYSNASLFWPNEGVSIQTMITFGYHF